jgi:hypothetical protein
MARLAFALLISVLVRGQAPPDPVEQTRILSAIRQKALSYTSNLPNFICNQVTNRFMNYSGEKWELVDSFEQQLTFFDRRESYKLIEKQGKPVRGHREAPGVTSSGEFGSMLHGVFDAQSKTQFFWLEWSTFRARPVAVLTYHVEQQNSFGAVTAPGRSIRVGYSGRIEADRETYAVLRLTIHAEVPQDFPLQDVDHVLEYGMVLVGGDEFLLPIHSELRSRADAEDVRDGKRRLLARTVAMRNETDFVQYRKYTTDAAIKFETAK